MLAKYGKELTFSRDDLEQTISVRFEKVSQYLPGHTAITSSVQCWSYQELDSAANRIANAILQRTGPGHSCMAYLVDHSSKMVCCALAILKRAKASLCIHPDMPAEAQRDITFDAKPDLLVTTSRFEKRYCEILADQGRILLLEDIGSFSDDKPQVIIQPRDPAIINYTSGLWAQQRHGRTPAPDPTLNNALSSAFIPLTVVD